MKAYFCENCGSLNLITSNTQRIEVDGVDICSRCFYTLKPNNEFHSICRFSESQDLNCCDTRSIINQLRHEAELREDNNGNI